MIVKNIKRVENIEYIMSIKRIGSIRSILLIEAMVSLEMSLPTNLPPKIPETDSQGNLHINLQGYCQVDPQCNSKVSHKVTLQGPEILAKSRNPKRPQKLLTLKKSINPLRLYCVSQSFSLLLSAWVTFHPEGVVLGF